MINESEITWLEKEIIGHALQIYAAPNDEPPIDSNGDPIVGAAYYRVGKHRASGKVAIIKLDK